MIVLLIYKLIQHWNDKCAQKSSYLLCGS